MPCGGQCKRSSKHRAPQPAVTPFAAGLTSLCATSGRVCRRRVRVTVQRYLAEKPFKVSKIEVFREEYEGPYTGGRELPASCGAESGFSEGERCAQTAAESHLRRCLCAPPSMPHSTGKSAAQVPRARSPLLCVLVAAVCVIRTSCTIAVQSKFAIHIAVPGYMRPRPPGRVSVHLKGRCRSCGCE